MHTPPGRLREPSQIGALAIVALAATLLLLFALRPHDGLKTESAAAAAAVSWTGLVGEGRPRVATDRWQIVVLKAPSLAQRLAAVGGAASEEQERRWTTEAEEAQKQLLSRIALQGVEKGMANEGIFRHTRARVAGGAGVPLGGRNALDGIDHARGKGGHRAVHTRIVRPSPAGSSGAALR